MIVNAARRGHAPRGLHWTFTMAEPLEVAVVGLGRMGVIHALHVHELAQQTKQCTLAALVDADIERARRFAAETGNDVPIFASVEELIQAGGCNGTVIVTP